MAHSLEELRAVAEAMANNASAAETWEHRTLRHRAYVAAWAVAEIERLRAILNRVMLVNQQHQPAGSPPPGDEACIAAWVLEASRKREEGLREVLGSLQWSGTTRDSSERACCPSCGAVWTPTLKHNAGCGIAAALAAKEE